MYRKRDITRFMSPVLYECEPSKWDWGAEKGCDSNPNKTFARLLFWRTACARAERWLT